MRLWLLLLAGCASPSHRLAPTVPLVGVRADGVRARAVELVPPDPYRSGHVVVELENRTNRRITIARDRLEFVGLARPTPPGTPAWPSTDSGSLGGAGGVSGSSGSMSGSSGSGSSGSGSSGSSSGSWGSAGAGLGAGVLGAIVLAPLLVAVLVDVARSSTMVLDAPDALEPGATARFDVTITPPTDGVEQHLTLGTALDDGRRALDVPVIDPAALHGGWRPDRRIEHLVLRLGGGPFWGDDHYSGTGGIEALAGGAIGPVQIRLGGSAGISFGGAFEVSTTHRAFGEWLAIAPSIDVQAGWALIGRTRFVSSTVGFDITLPVERRHLLGSGLIGQRLGIYGKLGPVWTDEGRLTRWEVGMAIR